MAKTNKHMKNNINIELEDKKKKKKKNEGVEHKGDPKKKNKKSKANQNEKFNFDNEIVIGVNILPNKKKDKPSKKAPTQNNEKNKSKKKKETKNQEKDNNEILIKNMEKKSNTNKKKNNNKNVKVLSNTTNNQKEKNSKKIKKIIKIILIIALFIGITIFIMTTPLFNVTNIEVLGNNKITKERIESLSQINLNVNTYQYSKREIIKNIKEEPYVDSVEVKRLLPSKIQINVKERTPSYIIMYSSSYVYINNQGYILEITNEPLNLPVIEGYTTSQEKLLPGNRLESDDLEKINTVLKIIEAATNNEILDKITGIDISDKNNYILKMENERKTVYLGDASSINDRIIMLKEILIKEANFTGEVFMQNLNKIYFRQEN